MNDILLLGGSWRSPARCWPRLLVREREIERESFEANMAEPAPA